MSASAEARRAAILETVGRDGFVTLTQLCEVLQCSAATVRRDLAELQRAGFVQRTHGGAVREGARERPFHSKITEMAEAKQRIAEAAVHLVRPGLAVGFSGGTTTQFVARHVAATVPDLTVVTNAITVAMEFANSQSRVIVTGGELRNETFELVGPLAEPAVAHIHLDLFFAGVDGLSVENGLTTHSPLEARINRVLIERSNEVIVVADHTKLGRKTLAHIAPLDMAQRLVTDQDSDSDALAGIERAGVRVLLA